jgi:Asp/Glu/hydantoin racemase
MKKIAVIHTTPATIDSLTSLIKNEIKDVKVVNILDDSILIDMINNNHVERVEQRWLKYAEIATSLGVDAVLSACSTVGEFAEKANEILKVPVYRIDEAMAEKAVAMGNTISVFATLSSTLEPTSGLIKRKAAEAGKSCTINTVLVPEAYDELMKGNRDLHNKKIQESILKYADTSDVLVLAQASMASAVEGLAGIDPEKVLTSPKLGVGKLKKDLSD